MPWTPPTYRSVGRLSAGHHKLILPLYRLRLNAPLQHRLHQPSVTMLARAFAQYTAPRTAWTIHTVATSVEIPGKWLIIRFMCGRRHLVLPPHTSRPGSVASTCQGILLPRLYHRPRKQTSPPGSARRPLFTPTTPRARRTRAKLRLVPSQPGARKHQKTFHRETPGHKKTPNRCGQGLIGLLGALL